ncbi:PPE family protein, partial [Mycobacterium intermedium]
MNFLISPPEINSARIFGGVGPGPLLAAAEAWDAVAAELGSAASSFSSLTSAVLGSAWQGRASSAMAGAAGGYLGWLTATGAQAERAATQARLSAAAFEATLAATVHPAAVLSNRTQLRSLVISNLLGFNAPAIAAAEAEYEMMWAQDVAAMLGYHAGASAAVSVLTPFAQLVQNPSAAVAAFVASTQSAVSNPAGRVSIFNAGLANLGVGNVGFANVGTNGVGLGNVGDANLGFGNFGQWNVGIGNLGNFNLGSGNSGVYNVGPGNLGSYNVGLGNAGIANFGFGNAGTGNIGFGNTGTNNVGFGLSGDGQVGFGAWNTGTGNVGLFNSGTGNVGFFNSGTGNWGIGNSGEFNTGLFNAGRWNTGWANTGLLNTGVGNPGSYNSGSFNVGVSNTGDFNPGRYNTGWANTGDYNTGWANTGHYNTGGFNQGDLNNGFFWRGDNQGQMAGDYTITIPRIAIGFEVDVPINIPVTGTLGSLLSGNPIINVQSFTIPQLRLNGSELGGTIGPIVVNSIVVNGPSLDLVLGGPGQSIQLGLSGPGLGPVVIPVLSV